MKAWPNIVFIFKQQTLYYSPFSAKLTRKLTWGWWNIRNVTNREEKSKICTCFAVRRLRISFRTVVLTLAGSTCPANQTRCKVGRSDAGNDKSNTLVPCTRLTCDVYYSQLENNMNHHSLFSRSMSSGTNQIIIGSSATYVSLPWLGSRGKFWLTRQSGDINSFDSLLFVLQAESVTTEGSKLTFRNLGNIPLSKRWQIFNPDFSTTFQEPSFAISTLNKPSWGKFKLILFQVFLQKQQHKGSLQGKQERKPKMLSSTQFLCSFTHKNSYLLSIWTLNLKKKSCGAPSSTKWRQAMFQQPPVQQAGGRKWKAGAELASKPMAFNKPLGFGINPSSNTQDRALLH